MSVAASGVHCGSAVLKCPMSRRAAANRVDQSGAVDGPPELSSCGGTAVNSRKRPSESRIIPTMPGTLGNGSSRPTTPVSLVETVAEDVRPHLFVIAQLIAAAGDHDAQLAFIVSTRRNSWAQNGASRGQQRTGRLEEEQRFSRNLMVEFGGVLAVIASHADDLCRLDGHQQRRLRERNAIHAAAGKAFNISIARVRRLKQQACDLIAARNGFDQSIVGLAIELEAAIFHEGLSKHER